MGVFCCYFRDKQIHEVGLLYQALAIYLVVSTEAGMLPQYSTGRNTYLKG